MEKKRLEIVGMSYSQSQTGAYALILGEVGGKRRIPIIIGGFEAQSIAIELEKMKPSRPLTHDLMKNFADTYNITLKEVVINKFVDGIFFAKLVWEHYNNETDIDSRTSDAVALAIRFRCPIYTHENILTEAGIIFDESPSKEKKSKVFSENKTKKNKYEDYSINELQNMLKKAVDKEDYEKASLIRDEINRKK